MRDWPSRHWRRPGPQSLAELDHEAVQWTIAQMARDKKLADERLELLNALYDAKFQLEWHIEPSDLWRELVLQALERKDMARARDVLKRIESPGSLVRMRIDRRFDPIVQAEPNAFDVAAASQAECRKLRREMTANPTRLGPVVQYMYSLFSVGEYGEVISLADRVLAQNAKASKDKPAFDDVADTLNWIYDLKSQALRGLGRWDEALVNTGGSAPSTRDQYRQGEPGHQSRRLLPGPQSARTTR